ncbi:hypothetical protein FALBO_1676 [Fusarium albosuccineum]|uniref:Reverse transcriptase domain-containing protein n=1 Tax=Fusarium albosuccineum TaxID=1237068 RepID=A0A8H4LP77_9HYPO|nr:hypothetical protein FALBO_1676 [Fusarium albosuccineum]
MASSSIVSQTLKSITSVKLKQISKQKTAYEAAKVELLEATDGKTNPERARTLVEGAAKLPAMAPLTSNYNICLDNLKRFLEQAELDMSVSPHLMERYERSVRTELERNSEKYRYAELYGKLVKEWISSRPSADGDSPGRSEMHDQRAAWEAYVFEPKETDKVAIQAALHKWFHESSKDVSRAFNDLAKGFQDFQKSWDDETHFDEQSLKNCMRSLQKSGLLNDEKRTELLEVLNNKVVLNEMVDVLNMRMRMRDSWTWDSDCIVEQRRHLNGRFRFFSDEDLLQTIFLYYIGRKWAVEARKLLMKFFLDPKVMKPASRSMNRQETRRREFFLASRGGAGSGVTSDSVHQKLDKMYKDQVLFSQLPNSMEELRSGYDQEEAAEDIDLALNLDFGLEGDNTEQEARKSHIDVVQDLLKTIQSDLLLRKRLGHDTAVIRSDFKWFGPSTPHSSIFSVLEFLGVNEEWLDFFRRSLECPLRFQGEEDGGQPARLRKRGLPLSTPIADFMAESMLFCLDFAVNQEVDGARLWRLHDDMWIWDSPDKCARAWWVVADFSRLFGLDLNKEKTGSVVIKAAEAVTTGDISSILPTGNVSWGFLKLEPASGLFVIDQAKVDTHISELRIQLEGCKTVFDWIHAWNVYGCRFFMTNFGSLANCYSVTHVDNILRTLRHVQESVFQESVGERLKKILGQRFGVTDITDGFIYYPVSLGGLGLRNPFISYYMYRGPMLNPDEVITRYLEDEEAEYRSAKATFESPDHHAHGDNVVLGVTGDIEDEPVEDVDLDYDGSAGDAELGPEPEGDQWRSDNMDIDAANLESEPFFSFGEYTRHRSRTSKLFGDTLEKLRSRPEAKTLDKPNNIDLPVDWWSLSEEDQWVTLQHAEEVVSRFGSMTMVEGELLPKGVLDMLTQSRFKWSN